MNRSLVVIILFLLLLGLRQFASLPQQSTALPLPGPDNTFSQPEQAIVRVKRVVDGDTLLLESGERVRLLGVDTPETKKPNTPVQLFGPEASAFTTQMVEGKEVRLVFDRERFDKYHRLLAFVYVGDVCLNEELIRNGLSAAQLQYPFRSDMKRLFTAAEAQARANRVGLWSIGSNSIAAPQQKPMLPTGIPVSPSQLPEMSPPAYPGAPFPDRVMPAQAPGKADPELRLQ